MRKFTLALLLLATTLSAFAVEPPPARSRREMIDKLVTLSHAEALEKTALLAVFFALEDSAPTPEQKDALKQIHARALSRNTRALWVSAYERNLDDKALAEALAMYESSAAERTSEVVRDTLFDVLQERLKNTRPAAERDLLAARQTMADMQSLAVALDARATDTHDYPESCDLQTLAKLLVPTYLSRMLTRDGWGHEFVYIGSPNREGFRIVSAGSDGVFEAGSRTLTDTPQRPTDRFEDDLILQNEAFIQAPRVLLDKNQ